MDDGVYFGLPREEYHDIPRLSASGIKTLLSSPEAFWADSWMNPARRKREHTDATQIGELFHDYLLEGAEVFFSRYHVLPDPGLYEKRGIEVLSTGRQIYPLARKLDISTGKTLLKISKEIAKVYCPIKCVLWPSLMEEEEEKAKGRTHVKNEIYQNILNIEHAIEENPEIRSIFKGGAPEVSILWTDRVTGVKMKCRADYLKPVRDSVVIIDLKSFSNVDRSEDASHLVSREIANNNYFIQPPVYTAALKAAHIMGAEKFHGDAPNGLVEAISERQIFPFFFLFVHSGGLPIVIPRMFSRFGPGGKLGASENAYWIRGSSQARYGVTTFRDKMSEFGPNRPWIVKRSIKPLQDENFPIWAFEEKRNERI